MTFPQQWSRTRRRAVVHILFHSPCTSYFRLSSTTARKAASAFHFSLLVFSPLLFQYPWPRRPLVTSHTRSPLGRTPGFTLTPVIFVIPGDFSFVLLCTHRAPGSSRPACFLEETHFTLFLLGRHRFGSTHGGLVPRIVPNAIGTSTTSVLKNPSTAFSCRKVSGSQPCT